MANYDVNERIPFSISSKSILQKQNSFPEVSTLLKSSIVSENYNFYYFNYGRNALAHLFNELNLKGKKIIFPAFICPSLAYSALSAGAEISFADINLSDFNVDINSLKKNINNVSAVVAVHTFGFPFDVNSLLKLKEKNKFILIEDCAHAFFAKYNGKYTGNYGDFVLFSMCKQIPNLPGAVLLSKKELKQQNLRREGPALAELLRLSSGPHQFFFNIARSSKKLPEESLMFSKIPALPSTQSCYLFSSLFSGLHYSVKRKQTVAEYYYKRLKKSKNLIPQKLMENTRPSWFNFNVRLKPDLAHIRDKLLLELRKKKIFCDRIWYMPPIFLKEFKADEKNYPNASLLAKTIINLPIEPDYTEEDVNYLLDSVEGTINKMV